MRNSDMTLDEFIAAQAAEPVQLANTWWSDAIRAHQAEHGPSGGAWNISMVLERLARCAPSPDAENARLQEVVDKAWAEARELVRGTNADLCKTPGKANRIICDALTGAVHNRNLRTLDGRAQALIDADRMRRHDKTPAKA